MNQHSYPERSDGGSTSSSSKFVHDSKLFITLIICVAILLVVGTQYHKYVEPPTTTPSALNVSQLENKQRVDKAYESLMRSKTNEVIRKLPIRDMWLRDVKYELDWQPKQPHVEPMDSLANTVIKEAKANISQFRQTDRRAWKALLALIPSCRQSSGTLVALSGCFDHALTVVGYGHPNKNGTTIMSPSSMLVGLAVALLAGLLIWSKWIRQSGPKSPKPKRQKKGEKRLGMRRRDE